MRSFVVCYPQRVRESSEQKTPCSLAPGCFGQIGRPGFQDSTSCTNAAHIFGEPQLIKQMPLMIIFYFSAHLLSLPSRGAWIEISMRSKYARLLVSLPSRGAWIEISALPGSMRASSVAPLAGSVDRNVAVAQLLHRLVPSLPSRGAWIEIPSYRIVRGSAKSLPSRGAWIEMRRKRYCDRPPDESLPSRGAWIEIWIAYPRPSIGTRRSPRGERG